MDPRVIDESLAGLSDDGWILVHSHPDGSTLSYSDIRNAVGLNLYQSRVIGIRYNFNGGTFEKMRYTITRPTGGWQELFGPEIIDASSESLPVNRIRDIIRSNALNAEAKPNIPLFEAMYREFFGDNYISENLGEILINGE